MRYMARLYYTNDEKEMADSFDHRLGVIISIDRRKVRSNLKGKNKGFHHRSNLTSRF